MNKERKIMNTQFFEFKNNNKNLINNMNKIQTPTLNFIEYYIQGLVEQNQKNITEVKKTASILLNGNCLKKHDWLLVKIKNQIERYGLKMSVERVLSNIVNDDYLHQCMLKMQVNRI